MTEQQTPFYPFAPERLPSQVFPTMPLLGLTDDEIGLIQALQNVALRHRRNIELCEAYYLGLQVIQNLRIAIPRELEFLRTIVGWPAMAVDPYVERLHADGFRLAGATDVDERIADVMAANGFDAEQSLSFTDALSMGHSYWTVGSPLEPGDAPLITVESPLNMSVLWDLRGINARAAMQEFWSDGRLHASVLVPGKTITMALDDNGKWVIADRDEHGFDFVPVVRVVNRPRTHERNGRSEITPALRSITDSACRTLLGLEVARELYSVPQKIILGAAESDFQNSDGTPRSVWDTYIHKTLALTRTEDGQLPEVKQMTPYDPSAFTKILDWYASAAAGIVAATPQDMGLYTQGNPASAEAVQAGEARRDRRAENMQQMFGVPLVKVAQLAMRFQNKGVLPDEFRRLETDWSPVTRPIPGVTSDAVTKEIAAGAVPATSDVTLKKLGYSAVDRLRLAQDRDADQGASFLQEIAHSVTTKALSSENRLANEAKPATVPPTRIPTPAEVFGGRSNN